MSVFKRLMEKLSRMELRHPKLVLGNTPMTPQEAQALDKRVKQVKKARIKVAIDESIGAALARKIESRGYEIVCRAGHAETDESWMKRALKANALFVISPDLDIPSMIERENLPMVWIDFLFAGHINPTLSADMPKEQKHAIWATYLSDRIQAKLKFLGKEFGGL